ncbi:MAG: efflux RND transporter permease subunit [Terriglobia bacterium]
MGNQQSAIGNQESSYWFARHSRSIIFLIITLALVGGYLGFNLPVAVFPSTDFPRVIIGVDNGVMPIDQMMVTITRPLEEAVNSVEGLESVRSITSRGSAEIDLFFNWNVNMFQTLERVNSAVARVQTTLPPGAQIETHRLTFASFPIIGYSLTSDTVPQTELWQMATYDLKPRLNRLNGVSTVIVQGGDEPEFEISPDPAKLVSARVTVPDILEAVRRTNLIDSPGLLGRNHQLFLGLVSAQVHTPDEIAGIVIKTTKDGVPVRVEDVATVGASVKPVYTIVTANAKPAVLLSIDRQPDSNTVLVANEVHQEIEQIRRSLPRTVSLRAFYDQSEIVESSITSVRDAILIGLILASIILVVFLRDWGTSLVAGMVIPATLLVTLIALKLLGQSFNLMTLGGLAAAVGLVIDDAIVVVENIVLHRDAGEGRLQAIQSAVREITVPLVGSTVTPVVVFLPLVSMTGVEGTFFRALAVTMAVSLFTSLALALFWTPNLSLHLLRKEEHADRTPESAEIPEPAPESAVPEEMRRLLAAEESTITGFFARIIRFYERWLRRALRHPVWLGALCAVLIVASFFCYKALGTDLLPAMDEGGFILDYITPPGSSLPETDRMVTHIEKLVRDVPEVESTSRRTGLQLGLAAVTEANTGDIAVKLKSKRSRGIEEIISELRTEIAQQEPAVDVEFTQVLQDMIGDLTGAPEPIQIKLFSEDADLLSQWAPQVADAIGKIEIGKKKPVVDVANGIDNATSGPAVMFQVNPATAARAGFTAEEVTTDAAAILEGEPAPTPVVVNDRPYTLRVRFPEAGRASLDAMSNTVLVSSGGQTATLGSLATVTELPGQTEILRENLQRDLAVTARLEGADLGTGIAAVRQAVNDLKLPSSIRVVYGGLYQEQQRSFHDLVIVLLLALVLVFLVLLFEFRSFSAPIAILSSAVLSTSGVFLALLITGVTFNISSFMGLIMVIGIVAKNGILLLDADDKFRTAGFPAEEAMIQAGRRRLRPIVMTALAAVAGMLPLSLGLGAGSQMLQPLAIAVIGGITVSMVLSLIITPAMQFYLNRQRAGGSSKD